MNCPKCGNLMNDGARFCEACGSPAAESFQSEAQQYNPYAQPQQQYGQTPYGYQQPYAQQGYNPYGPPMPPYEVDKPDTLINVLSFFIPILGLVMYFVERDKKPIKAKAALKWALISWAVSAVLVVLYIVFMVAMFFIAEGGQVYYY